MCPDWARLRRRAGVWFAATAVAAAALVVSGVSAERAATVVPPPSGTGGSATTAVGATTPEDLTTDVRLWARDARRLGGPGAVLQRSAPPSRRSATLIFLHGQNGSGEAVMAALRAGLLLAPRDVRRHLTVLAPTAVSPSGARSWYGIRRSRGGAGGWAGATFNTTELAAAAARIDGIITREVGGADGTPPRRVLLMGTSQGGGLALTVALRSRRRLAGCGVAAAFLPEAGAYPAAATEANKGAPYYMLHGGADRTVPLAAAAASRDVLVGAGRRVTFRVLEGRGHNLLDIRFVPWVLGILGDKDGLGLF